MHLLFTGNRADPALSCSAERSLWPGRRAHERGCLRYQQQRIIDIPQLPQSVIDQAEALAELPQIIGRFVAQSGPHADIQVMTSAFAM